MSGVREIEVHVPMVVCGGKQVQGHKREESGHPGIGMRNARLPNQRVWGRDLDIAVFTPFKRTDAKDFVVGYYVSISRFN